MRRLRSAALLAGAMVVAACGPAPASGAPGSQGISPAPASGVPGSQEPGSLAPATQAPATRAPSSGTPAASDLVGIALPTRSSRRWIADGAVLVKALADLGYRSDLEYADDDAATQRSQVETMIADGAGVLVIAAIDGTALADTLRAATAAGVRTLAYDRLIRDTPDVQYLVTFDDFKVGVLQATSIEQSLELKSAAEPLDIELFAGPADDARARLYFDGAMSVLQPYIDVGRLSVRSGQTAFPDQVSTLRWSGEVAGRRMASLLSTTYAGRRIDAVLSPDDAISGGIVASLKAAGYYTADKPGPVVTGGGADLAAVRSILAGEQTSTVFEDTRLLAAQAARMVDQALKGSTVDISDTTTYKNGVKTVPAFLLDMVLVTKDDAREELVDSGWYTADELGL